MIAPQKYRRNRITYSGNHKETDVVVHGKKSTQNALGVKWILTRGCYSDGGRNNLKNVNEKTILERLFKFKITVPCEHVSAIIW